MLGRISSDMSDEQRSARQQTGMHITLAQPSSSYEPDIQKEASRAEVSSTCNVPYPYPPDGASQWLTRIHRSIAEKKSVVFLVLVDDDFAGVMSLNRIDTTSGKCDLDYWIAVDHQGRGVGSHAIQLALDEARARGLKRVFGTWLADNGGSCRVLQKNGFVERLRLTNDGQYGSKFLGREMRQFEKDLGEE